MDTLNFLFEVTIYSGVIFVAIMLLKTCFKSRMSPFLHYAVWLVLVLRLAIPLTIASPVHLFVIPAVSQNQAGAETQPQGYLPVTEAETNKTDAADTQPQTGITGEQVNSGTQTTPAAAHMPMSLSLPQIAALVWLAGTGICLSYITALYVSLHRKIRRNAAQPSKRLAELFEQAKAETGVKADIKLVCQYEYGTPSLMFPKTIMMPADALIAMDDEQTKFALRHELMHFRRGDHIVNILLSVLNAFYWFNPFVWAAFGQMRRDMEAACDGIVVKRFDIPAKSRYASLILNLSSQPEHRQLVLGMSRSGLRKAAERRVKCVFMKGESNMSVKLITVLLAAALLFTCFTTACQPVTEVSESNNPVSYPQNNPETAILLAPKPPESYKIQEHWSDTVENEKVKIIIDADVFVPDVTEYPIVKLERAGFTQQRADELINYFAKGKCLYLPRPMTKAHYQRLIDEAKRGRLIDGEYVVTQGSLDEVKQWEELQAAAPEDSPVIYTDSTLKPFMDETGNEIGSSLSVMIGNGEADESITEDDGSLDNDGFIGDDGLIGIGNFTDYASTGFYYTALWDRNEITESRYGPGELFDKVDMTKDEALKQADKVISDLGIKDLMLVSAGRYVTPDDPEKCGYELMYSRESGGIPLYWFTSFGRNGAEEPPPYSQPLREEVLTAYVTKDGIDVLCWEGCAKVVETVSENAELLPFESIKQALKDRIFYKKSFLREGMYQDFTITVTSAELRMGYIDVKDNAKQALMVPVWVFTTQETYTENNRTRSYNEETYMFNAIDGGAIERSI